MALSCTREGLDWMQGIFLHWKKGYFKYPWRYLKSVQLRHLGTQPSSGLGSAGWMAGLGDLKGLFQSKQGCDSAIVWIICRAVTAWWLQQCPLASPGAVSGLITRAQLKSLLSGAWAVPVPHRCAGDTSVLYKHGLVLGCHGNTTPCAWALTFESSPRK